MCSCSFDFSCKKSPLYPEKIICFLANWTSVFSCLFFFFYPAIHSCLLFHFTSHTPPIHPPFLFFPFSHPSVTTYTSLTSMSICCSLPYSPDMYTTTRPFCMSTCLCLFILHTLSHSLAPLHCRSPAQHFHSHLWVISNVYFAALNVFLIFC